MFVRSSREHRHGRQHQQLPHADNRGDTVRSLARSDLAAHERLARRHRRAQRRRCERELQRARQPARRRRADRRPDRPPIAPSVEEGDPDPYSRIAPIAQLHPVRPLKFLKGGGMRDAGDRGATEVLSTRTLYRGPCS